MTNPTLLSVTLPEWEGPLDLLLHVIRTHQLDILNIPIAFVTEQYLTYLAAMQAVDLDIAGEYLEMAATLAHIKSRMMLPSPPPDEEDGAEEEGEDPREELVRRLLEYQRYKEAARQLADRPMLGRDIFVPPAGATTPELMTEETPLLELGLFDLAEALRAVLERTKLQFTHEVVTERITISERIGELVDLLRPGVLTPFDELIADARTRFDIVITLLALLEMTKLKMTRLFQASPEGVLYVTLGGSRSQRGAEELDRGRDTRVVGPGRSRAKLWPTRTARQKKRSKTPKTLRLLQALRLGTHRRRRRPSSRSPRR